MPLLESFDEDREILYKLRFKVFRLWSIATCNEVGEYCNALKLQYEKLAEANGNSKSYNSKEWKIIRLCRDILVDVGKRREALSAAYGKRNYAARQRLMLADQLLSAVSGGITAKQEQRILELQAQLNATRQRRVEEKQLEKQNKIVHEFRKRQTADQIAEKLEEVRQQSIRDLQKEQDAELDDIFKTKEPLKLRDGE